MARIFWSNSPFYNVSWGLTLEIIWIPSWNLCGKRGNSFRLGAWNWWNNNPWLNCDDNMLIIFFKIPLGFWFNTKCFTFMYMPLCKDYSCISMWNDFNLKDYGQSYLILQITMQVCVTWILYHHIQNFDQRCHTCWRFLLQMQHL